MAIQGEALARSFSGTLPEAPAGQSRTEPDQGRGWVAVGLIVAAIIVTGAGAALWWGRRRD
jgi:hypothetical protein